MKNLITFLLLPILYFQGKRLRKTIPQLPEARGTTGVSGEAQSTDKNILLLGESTIAGVGADTHQEGFAGALAETLSNNLSYKINWRVYARSGYTAKRVTSKLIPKLEETQADLLIIGLGGNDTFTLNKNWTEDIKNLIKATREKFPTSPLVFINLPPVAEFPALPTTLRYCLGHHMDKLRSQLITLTQDQVKCYFIDQKITLRAWSKKYGLENKPELYFSDGIHPKNLTYNLWAKSVAEYITTNKLL